jgi:hypothetical protein
MALPQSLCLARISRSARAELELAYPGILPSPRRGLASSCGLVRISCWPFAGFLEEAERDEEHATRHVPVRAQGERDCPAPGLHTDLLADLQTGLAMSFGLRRDDRLRLERVENAGAACHGAGVPVFQHAAGGQHQREVVIGRSSGGRTSSAGTILARPSAVGNRSPNRISLPGWSGASHG